MARKSTVFNLAALIAAITKAEENGPLKNLGVLYDAVSINYATAMLANGSTAFGSPSLVKKWIEAEELETKTEPGKKGRPGKDHTKFFVDKLARLENALVELYGLLPAEFHDKLEAMANIIDEKETVETTVETEETLPPTMPVETEETRIAA